MRCRVQFGWFKDYGVLRNWTLVRIPSNMRGYVNVRKLLGWCKLQKDYYFSINGSSSNLNMLCFVGNHTDL